MLLFADLAENGNSWKFYLIATVIACSFELINAAPLGQQSSCYCFPSESCWPSSQEWSAFNSSINGKLVASVPLASVCHDGGPVGYNATACQQIQDQWLFAELHYTSSSSVMTSYFGNQSCEAFSPRSAQCVLGTYTQYAVNVTSPEDIQKTLAFAKAKNIRFVIRNTGHDFHGKSTGAGGLAVWTHHLKDIELKEYSSSWYTGKAFKFGAGVQGFEAQAAAHAKGLVVTSGTCPTVGIVGGYTQGGGHSAIASKVGLAADQVLEWQVVLSDGQYVVASPKENSDLYWALCGGGGGTYAVVVSMTVRAYADFEVTSGAILNFASAEAGLYAYMVAVSGIMAEVPNFTKAGIYAPFFSTSSAFQINMMAPGLKSSELKAALSSIEATLKQSNVNYNLSIGQFSTYLDAADVYLVLPPVTDDFTWGGWFLPRDTIANNMTEISSTIRWLYEEEMPVSGIALDVSEGEKVPNGVFPGWRQARIQFYLATPWNNTDWDANLAIQKRITERYNPALQALAPDAGVYLNEANSFQPDWQKAFYGEKYSQLLSIKDKYDPDGMFYALTGVGSERWAETAEKKLCRVA